MRWFNRKSFEDPAKFRGFLMALVAAVSSGVFWVYGTELEPEVQSGVVTVGVTLFTWLTGRFIRAGENGSVRPALHADKLLEAHDVSFENGRTVGRNEALKVTRTVYGPTEEESAQAYRDWLAGQR